MWSFGGPMVVDKAGDFRKNFNESFVTAFGQKFPKEKVCFDYVWSINDNCFVEWVSKVPTYTPVPIGGAPGETPFSQLFVPTSDTVRLTYLMDLLARKGKYCMLVGSGSGKTSMISQYLSSLDKDVDGFLKTTINMSYYTDSKRLQGDLELPIDKRSGRRYGPPATKRLIVFIDDINLPYVETYGTQNAIALLTQHMSYATIFDRGDLGLRKELVDMQYIAAMNPTSGSFYICERAQRHFATFASVMPSRQDLTIIFRSLFSGHVNGFATPIMDCAERLVDASLTLYEEVSRKFLPSAVRFTYNWSLRELTNIFQGICLMKDSYYSTYLDVVNIWVHEFNRVISDRFFFISEIDTYSNLMREVMKKQLNVQNADELIGSNNVYTLFATTVGSYRPVESFESLRKVLDNKLLEYNESNAMMDLVLFNQAI